MEITLPKRKYSTGREVVNWVEVKGEYTLDNETTILIISNKLVEKTSKKTGNKRKERRLEVALKGFEEFIEIGTESLKKLSFIKRLRKLSKTIVKTVKTYALTIWKPIEKDFLGRTIEECEDNIFEEMSCCETTKEVHKWFKKYAKFYHPDSLGRELFPEEEIIYSLLVQGRNEMCEMIALADEVFGK